MRGEPADGASHGVSPTGIVPLPARSYGRTPPRVSVISRRAVITSPQNSPSRANKPASAAVAWTIRSISADYANTARPDRQKSYRLQTVLGVVGEDRAERADLLAAPGRPPLFTRTVRRCVRANDFVAVLNNGKQNGEFSRLIASHIHD